MKAFFTELFEYNHHTNQKLADLFSANEEKISEKSLKLISHILNAHNIWNSRIALQPNRFGVWELHTVQQLKDIDIRNFEQTHVVLENTDLKKAIEYRNSKGELFNNTAKDILFHVINHSTYHRAQIATEMKQNGLEPLTADYIFYKRQAML